MAWVSINKQKWIKVASSDGRVQAACKVDEHIGPYFSTVGTIEPIGPLHMALFKPSAKGVTFGHSSVEEVDKTDEDYYKAVFLYNIALNRTV